MCTLNPRLFIFSLMIGIAVTVLSAYKYPQDDAVVNKIIDRLKNLTQTLPQEKIYIQFDKPYYVAGEDIWYKTYLVNAQSHTPDSLSRIIYVELISPDGEVIKKSNLKVIAGFANGDFNLSDSLSQGEYQVRAYTNYMRNQPDEFFFRKNIKIWNDREYVKSGKTATKLKKNKTSETANTPNLDVQFFPEGGNLVAGFISKVGFKAINNRGRGQDISGRILNEAGQELLAFKSTHLGMGSFVFLPEAGKIYTAEVKMPDGKTQRYPFPAAQAQGYTMQVNNLFRDKIQVVVRQNVSNTTPEEVILIGHLRGTVVYAAKANSAKEAFIFNVPKADIFTGVVQFTLFKAATQEPLCERLVFANNTTDNLKLAIKSNKTQYKSREPVTLDITATDSEGKPMAGNFSLAVTDAQVQPEEYAANLANYFLLSSDLQGLVEQPGYYFNAQNAATVQDLDNLLLTQGWRRFVWKEVLTDKPATPKYFIEQSIQLKGQVNRLLTNKPLANADVLVFLTGKQGAIIQTKTDVNGRFLVNGLDFDSVSNVVVQGKNEKGKQNTTVLIDPVTEPPLRFLSPLEIGAPATLADYTTRMKKRQQIEDSYTVRNGSRVLKEVKVTAKKPQPERDPRSLNSMNATVIKANDQMAAYTNILQAIQGRVAGVMVTGNTITIRGGEPAFLLDGMRVDMDLITSINMSDVDYIEILKGAEAGFYASGVSSGLISVVTKRGGPGIPRAVTGITASKLMGYYKVREFYAPAYHIKKEEHTLPDWRSTLYWNPQVKTDAAGKATVTFYNADNVTGMHAVSEGVTQSGLVASQTVSIGGK